MKKSTTRAAVIVICLIAGLVGYFAYLSNKKIENNKEATMTPVQIALNRNLNIDYPPTPKEVVRFYNEILKCYYNENCTEEEIESLGMKARELFDAELLVNNEVGTYLRALKAEIKDYKDNKRKMTAATVASSTNVFYFEEDGFEFARLHSGYYVSESGKTRPSDMVFLLRKDDQKKWKIYGWTLAENVTVEQ